MRINKASIASGVSRGMIRHYEKVGLLPAVRRLSNGFRDYTPDDVLRLRFILTFSNLGFDFAEIRDLLSPWDEKHPKKQLQTLALAKAKDLREKAQALRAAEEVLMEMAQLGTGAPRPNSPVRALAEVSSTS